MLEKVMLVIVSTGARKPELKILQSVKVLAAWLCCQGNFISDDGDGLWKLYIYWEWSYYSTSYADKLKWLWINLVFALGLFNTRPSRMETWKRWRRRSDSKSANARDVRTRTHRAAMTVALRLRRDVGVHPLRNSPRTPPSSPSKWTPSLIQSSTTEMGKEIYLHELNQTELPFYFTALLFPSWC